MVKPFFICSALMFELKAHEIEKSEPKPIPQLLFDLNKYLIVVGQYSPLEKVYVKMTRNTNEFVTFIVIFTLTHLNRLAFGKNLLKYNKPSGVYGPAIAKQQKTLFDSINSNRFIDGHVFLLGLMTLMRQYHENNYLIEYVQTLASCILEMMEFNLR